MSAENQVAAETPAAETAAPAVPEVEEELSLLDSVKEVLKQARVHGGLKKGLHECCKALDKRAAFLCVLATNCNEPSYVRLVEALCKEHNIDLVKVADNMQLGEWCGLCKIDEEGKATHVVKASCAVVTHYGKESNATRCLKKHLHNA